MKRAALNHYIHSYVHFGRIGVLLEFGLDTQVSAQSSVFQQLATDLCLQIAAQDPRDVADLLAQPFLKAPTFKKDDELAPFQKRY